MGPSRWMIRRAVPNGPRVATTVGLVVVVAAAAAAVDVVVDDLITVDVAAEAAEDVVVAVGKRCFQPTSCIAEEVDDPTPDADVDDDVEEVAAFTFGLIRTVSFLIDFFTVALLLTAVSTLLLPPPPEAVLLLLLLR